MQIPIVLLVGYKGELGKSLSRYCKINDIPVAKLDLDINNQNLLYSMFNLLYKQGFLSRSPILINCAAYTKTKNPDIKKLYTTNVNGVGNLARVCNKYNIRLIQISSDAVFSTTPYQSIFKENDILNPTTSYGVSKYWGEETVKQLAMKYTILRTTFITKKFPSTYAYDNVFFTGDSVDVIAKHIAIILKNITLYGYLANEILHVGTEEKSIFEAASKIVSPKRGTYEGFLLNGGKPILDIAKYTNLRNK